MLLASNCRIGQWEHWFLTFDVFLLLITNHHWIYIVEAYNFDFLLNDIFNKIQYTTILCARQIHFLSKYSCFVVSTTNLRLCIETSAVHGGGGSTFQKNLATTVPRRSHLSCQGTLGRNMQLFLGAEL